MKRLVNRDLLKKLMKEFGTTPVEIKGVSISTLKKMAYEQYASFPKSITMYAICEAYQISLNDLFPLVEANKDGPDAA